MTTTEMLLYWRKSNRTIRWQHPCLCTFSLDYSTHLTSMLRIANRIKEVTIMTRIPILTILSLMNSIIQWEISMPLSLLLLLRRDSNTTTMDHPYFQVIPVQRLRQEHENQTLEKWTVTARRDLDWGRSIQFNRFLRHRMLSMLSCGRNSARVERKWCNSSLKRTRLLRISKRNSWS